MMIEYLKIEITPCRFAGIESKKLEIKIETDKKPEFQKSEIHLSNDLISFFDQIFDCAKREILKALLTSE